MADLLIGDSSTFFFYDHDLPGHDVFIGQSGDDDYDYEGGDDIGRRRSRHREERRRRGLRLELIGQGDPQPLFQDLDRKSSSWRVACRPSRPATASTRSRPCRVGTSTTNRSGDDIVPSAVGGEGFIGCDALDQDGLDRIAGLDALVPPLATDSAPIVEAASTRYCGLEGNVWGDGNILLGGGGSDTIEGRGADDIIDGDKYLGVRLSVRTDVNTRQRRSAPPT